MIKAVFALGVASDFHNHGIYAFGKDNDLPWGKIPEDFASFKEKTVGAVCVMGAKTYQSLPRNLPGRAMVAIGDTSRVCQNKSGELPDMLLSEDDWLQVVKRIYPDQDIAVIGGLHFILKQIDIFDEVHINFLMLTSEYDTIDPTVYVSDVMLDDSLKNFKLGTRYRIETSVDFCDNIKIGIWK